jgi:hypothetical protein
MLESTKEYHLPHVFQIWPEVYFLIMYFALSLTQI